MQYRTKDSFKQGGLHICHLLLFDHYRFGVCLPIHLNVTDVTCVIHLYKLKSHNSNSTNNLESIHPTHMLSTVPTRVRES